MNYAFLDTCSWIDFATGKNDASKHDFTDSNWETLRALSELKSSNSIVFLKNEIIDLEFKRTSVDEFVQAYDSLVLKRVRSTLEEKVMVHCDNRSMRKVLRETLTNLDQLLVPFQGKSIKLNQEVLSLYNEAIHINISESLKQEALGYAISKNHKLFESKKNNVNDFLILYSIQEWVESYKELKYLDETSQEHTIYFVTKNIKDFGEKNGTFKQGLGLSQLIKPIRNLSELVSKVRAKKHQSQDFLHSYIFDKTVEITWQSPIEEATNKLNNLIELKKEFFLSFLREKIDQIDSSSKLKYIGKTVTSKHENSRLHLPIIRSQNIINGKLKADNISNSHNYESLSLSRQGDILIPSKGAKAGEHCINNLKFGVTVHSNIYVFRIDQHKVNLTYLDYVLRCTPMRVHRDTIGMQRLNALDFMNFRIKLPPIEKQNNLVALFKEKEQEIKQDILGIKRKIKMILI